METIPSSLANDKSPPVPGKRLVAVDALRGFAALIVLFPHSGGFFSSLGPDSRSNALMSSLGQYGAHGVDIFFVLSGFVIAATSAGRRLIFLSVPRFLIRRLVRIAPPYWAAIALMLGCLLIQRWAGRGDGSFPSWENIVAHVAYLQDILGLPSLNVVFWTLCVEVQFYLFFAIASASAHTIATRTGFSRKTIALTGLTVSAGLSLALSLHAPGPPAFHGFFVNYWHEFALGVLAFIFISDRERRARRVCLAVIGGIVVVALLAHSWHTVTAVGTSLLILEFGRRGLLETKWNQAISQYFGRISYSLYLVHVPVIFLWLAVRMRFHPEWPVASWAFFLGMFVSSVVVAHALHVWVERPAMRWSRRCSPA